jgi:hypothetical protein
MKILILTSLFTLFFFLHSFAQKTEAIHILGDISTEKVFSIAQIKGFVSSDLGDFEITNHLGEPRGIAKQLRGFPVIRLLEQVELHSPSPKQLSEYYFVFEATDGYKVVFSWNELFNNPLGEQVYLITSKDEESMEEMEDGILLISKTDIRTRRRHIKNLDKIYVKRVE